MNETQQAWRLWKLLQGFGDALWTQYESAFLNLCSKESKVDATLRSFSTDIDIPF